MIEFFLRQLRLPVHSFLPPSSSSLSKRRRKNKPSLIQLPMGEYVDSLIIGRSSNRKKGRERKREKENLPVCVCLSHNTVALLAYVRNRIMIIITKKERDGLLRTLKVRIFRSSLSSRNTNRIHLKRTILIAYVRRHHQA